MKAFAFLAAAAIALAACGAREAPRFAVSDIEVTSNLTAVTSRQAAQYWGNLDRDLASAIAAEFVGESAPDGVNVAVDVDELSLARFLEGPADAARLSGTVRVTTVPGEREVGFYTVSASANEAATFLVTDRPVVTISPTDAEFYQAVVRAFARGVANAVRTGAAA